VTFIVRVTQLDEELIDAFRRLIPQLTRRPPPSREELGTLIDSPSILLIARHPDETGPIVGTGTLAIFHAPTGIHAHIEDVVVDRKSRGLGIGEELMTTLLETAKAMGLDGVSLTCNPGREEANLLYKKMGFKNWKTNVYWYDLK
jgi:ribosomal protein S18 acetylase RimI-like enzyme